MKFSKENDKTAEKNENEIKNAQTQLKPRALLQSKRALLTLLCGPRERGDKIISRDVSGRSSDSAAEKSHFLALLLQILFKSR